MSLRFKSQVETVLREGLVTRHDIVILVVLILLLYTTLIVGVVCNHTVFYRTIPQTKHHTAKHLVSLQ